MPGQEDHTPAKSFTVRFVVVAGWVFPTPAWQDERLSSFLRFALVANLAAKMSLISKFPLRRSQVALA